MFATPEPAPLPVAAATPGRPGLAALALFAAVAVPPLVAFSRPPFIHLVRELVAFFLWGLAVAAIGACVVPAQRPWAALKALWWALALLALGVALAAFESGSPRGPQFAAWGYLAAAALCLGAGALAADAPASAPWWRWIFRGWVVAGVLSAAVGAVQVLWPAAADWGAIATPRHGGRAAGNLDQPNHLSSLLLWSILAALALHEMQKMSRRVLLGVVAVAVFGVALSAGRLGLIGVLLLGAWGALDKRLSRTARLVMLAAALFYVVAQALIVYATGLQGSLGGASVMARPNNRLPIWADTLALIAMQPWRGVGFGEFNSAWTLSALGPRPPELYGHAHNLILHLLAELGLPLGAAVVALLLTALVRVTWLGARAGGPAGVTQRFVLAGLWVMALHSQLEFPLWFAYWLLPVAFLWGWLLRVAQPAAQGPSVGPRKPPIRGLLLGGLALGVGALLALGDYAKAHQLFIPTNRAGELQARVLVGRSSWFFAHVADYRAATRLGSEVDTELAVFTQARRVIVSPELMVAWAEALQRHGQPTQALAMVQRLRELTRIESVAFFNDCDFAPPQWQPFQCAASGGPLDWRVFTAPR